MKTKILTYLLVPLMLLGCSLSPGMDMKTSEGWLADGESVEIGKGSSTKTIFVEEITFDLISNLKTGKEPYKIGIGDKLSITVWGLPEVFPMTAISTEQSLRIVNTDGSIFFPFVGSIQALGKTQIELRNELTIKLSEFFTNPQLDVSIIKFESQRVYLLGEVTVPQKLPITETPLSLADALGLVSGLNTNTSAADEVFVIRQAKDNDKERIFRANLSSPASFLVAGEFYLAPQDIIYVNAKGTTKWNRIVSQFFPFSSFLNSVDNLTDD